MAGAEFQEQAVYWVLLHSDQSIYCIFSQIDLVATHGFSQLAKKSGINLPLAVQPREMIGINNWLSVPKEQSAFTDKLCAVCVIEKDITGLHQE